MGQSLQSLLLYNSQLYIYNLWIFGSANIENAVNQGLNGWIIDDINARVGGFTGLELEVLHLMLKPCLRQGGLKDKASLGGLTYDKQMNYKEIKD